MDSEQKDTSAGVQWFHVGPEQAGQRIDNFLLARLKGAPRSLIYRILRKGEVRVNKGRIKPEYRLQDGDEVRIPPVRLAEREEARPTVRVLKEVADNILYEDRRLLIINKPSGLAVHGGSGVSYGLIEAVRALKPEYKDIELVHRLDRDTSGCIVLAKRRSALRILHELLRENAMDKRYLALVRGQWPGGERVIDVPLHKNILRSGERMVQVSAEGKPSLSRLLPLASRELASLIEVKLETGRTHQARVHCAYVGYPIAGDDKYGDTAFNQRMKALGLQRLFLHAWRLRFTLSDDGTHIDIQAPLPNDLQNVLRQLDIDVPR
jgi:23S rRNA pseudouridine955/2504/2580 synthase